MNEVKYLVDNNALISLTVARVGSEYFRNHCHVTPDVLFEANEHPEVRRLGEVTSDFTAATFAHIRQLMSGLDPSDTQLIDLYRNKGAADPGLIAWLQEQTDADDGMLLADLWVLVTNDVAVNDLARKFGISTIQPSELAARIDQATNPESSMPQSW